MFELALPIFQAPMAGVQDGRLAIAVSQAGGLGALPCAMLSQEQLGAELLALNALDAPVNLNFFCHTPGAFDAAAEQHWRALLQPYFAEFGVALPEVSSQPSRMPFSQSSMDILRDIIHPPHKFIISFHFGLPSEDLCQQLRLWGAKIIASATTVAEAKYLAGRGVDAVIAQGLEAGGHRGHFLSDDLIEQMGLFALLPQIVAAVACPVIAAGGIADAQGVRAALALGASAAQVGSAYLLCPEANTSAVHRAALQSPAAQHTALTSLFSGRPARGIVNRLMRELGAMPGNLPAFPHASSTLAPLRAQAERQGIADFSPLWAGQNVAACKNIPAGQLTRQLAGFAI